VRLRSLHCYTHLAFVTQCCNSFNFLKMATDWHLVIRDAATQCKHVTPSVWIVGVLGVVSRAMGRVVRKLAEMVAIAVAVVSARHARCRRRRRLFRAVATARIVRVGPIVVWLASEAPPACVSLWCARSLCPSLHAG
jgi:hypothetical protein